MLASVSNRELFVPDGDKARTHSIKLANALAIELLHYGMRLDDKIIERISRHDRQAAEAICSRILKMYTIGDLNPPLFSDWEERTEFTFDEYIVQILGYTFQLSGNDLADPGYMSTLKQHINFRKMKRLKLADEQKSRQRFDKLVNSKVALEKKSQRDLVGLAEVYHTAAPRRIHSAEARIAVALGMVKSGCTITSALTELNAQPADVLRFAAAAHDFDGVKLPADVLYAKLMWKDRTRLLQFLMRTPFDELCEAMGNNRTAWERFMKHYHVYQQRDFRNRFTPVVAAAFISIGSRLDKVPAGRVREFVDSQRALYDITPTGNMAYRTFASRVQMAVEAKDFERLRAELLKRPGYLLRNLGSLSAVCTKETEASFLELARAQVAQVNPGVLFSIAQIDVNADYRIIDSKGNTTVTEADYNPVIGDVQELVEQEIRSRYGLPGRVKVQDQLKSKIVPFLSTNADLDRGSRIGFDDRKYLYFLMHWVQQAERRTDLDHSYVCLDAAWNAETIYFGNQTNAYIKQSGDITNAPAPHGGTEYGRIDLEKIPKKVRYIVPIMNVYSGDVFSENEVAYAGFMFTNKEKFSINQDHVRYDMTQPARSNIPFVIDVQAREILIVDFNNRRREGITAHSCVGEIRKVISAVNTRRFITIERFAQMLSGDEESVSLTITGSASGEGEIEPADLQSLVS